MPVMNLVSCNEVQDTDGGDNTCQKRLRSWVRGTDIIKVKIGVTYKLR